MGRVAEERLIDIGENPALDIPDVGVPVFNSISVLLLIVESFEIRNNKIRGTAETCAVQVEFL